LAGEETAVSPLLRLAVRDGFAAAHRLPGSGGRCEGLHGHNFAVELAVEGERLDPVTGMLLDFGVLKGALARILADLDHRDLNALPALGGASPSSENLALHILSRARQELAAHPVTVSSVTVWESEKASATARQG
jgi:6-pyruvoyltetrahydropterin/6-carboxytetrahydropterin synthase